MHENGVSQLPVIDKDRVVGSVDEAMLMRLLYDGVDFEKQQIFSVMGRPLITLDEDVDTSEAYRLLLSGATGVVILKNKIPMGVITRTDLINYWVAGETTP